MIRIVLSVYLLLFSGQLFPHAGGLDANGGHTDRNTGEYHCHRDGCVDLDGTPPSDDDTLQPVPADGLENNEALEALDQLRSIDIRVEMVPSHFPVYDRNLFPHWSDLDGDCEDTRAEILLQTTLIPVDYDQGNRCRVDTGYWYDPYTDQIFLDDDSMDIDHIVPLKEAYDSGAYTWSTEEKKAFANDRENLIAVSLSANRSKGDQDPAEWMPANTGFACHYLSAWVYLKTKYALSMDEEEHGFIKNALTGC